MTERYPSVAELDEIRASVGDPTAWGGQCPSCPAALLWRVGSDVPFCGICREYKQVDINLKPSDDKFKGLTL